MGPFLASRESEMSESISRKMAVKFAASLNLGNKMFGIVHNYI